MDLLASAERELLLRRTCRTQEIPILQNPTDWDTDSEQDLEEESDSEACALPDSTQQETLQARTQQENLPNLLQGNSPNLVHQRQGLLTNLIPAEAKIPSIGKWDNDIWKDSDPAPERRACTDQDKERLKAASVRVTEIAAGIRGELERKRQKVQKRKEFRKFMTWDNAEFTISPSVSLTAGMSNAVSPVKRENIIIFDWDDTLFPTWYLMEVVQPCLDSTDATLPEDSFFHDALAAHAKLVGQVLSAARSMAQVYIVTLGKRPWVEDSSRRFLPGLDMPSLLKRLGIHIYYAREHVNQNDRWAASLEDGVDVYMIAKRNGMKKCVKKALKKSGLKKVNAIAIGDSTAEIEAIQEVMWDDDADENRCKTVKFLSEPTLEALSSELQVLQSWISLLLAYDKDVDIDMGSPDKEAFPGMLPTPDAKWKSSNGMVEVQ